MIGRIFDAIEQGVQRPLCWLEGHSWLRRYDDRVCRNCGARRPS